MHMSSAAALNVVLNLALIPSWGASGAAAASLNHPGFDNGDFFPQ